MKIYICGVCGCLRATEFIFCRVCSETWPRETVEINTEEHVTETAARATLAGFKRRAAVLKESIATGRFGFKDLTVFVADVCDAALPDQQTARPTPQAETAARMAPVAKTLYIARESETPMSTTRPVAPNECTICAQPGRAIDAEQVAGQPLTWTTYRCDTPACEQRLWRVSIYSTPKGQSVPCASSTFKYDNSPDPATVDPAQARGTHPTKEHHAEDSQS